ncbi:MAG: Ig-like domain-containing protein, partial [Paramuribaculum sp.]|nr:Ig-like domain-containing protein [Paramuribaculum sp.]
KADGSITTLVLHSMPLGDNARKNVGVLWKVLDTNEELTTVEGFASDWNGYMPVSFTGSAYSSMSVKDDGDIAFLYEEATYGRSYSIVYLTLSIDEITKGAYTKVEEGDEVADNEKPVLTEEMLDYFIENSGITNQILLNKINESRDELLVNPTYEGYAQFLKMLKTVTEINDLGGYYVGAMAPSSVEAYMDALIAYEADPSDENAKHLENCSTYAHTLILKNDVAYRFNNRNHSNEFMAVGEDNTLIGTEDATSENSMFHLRAASAENIYKIHHSATDKFVEVQSETNTPHNMVDTDGEVAEVALNPIAGTNFFNLVVNNPKNEEYPALHLNDNHHVVIWRTPHHGSHWMIYPANPAEAESENILSPEGLEDMSLVELGANGSFTTHADAVVKAADSNVIAIEKGESAGSYIVKPLAEGSSEVRVALGPEVCKFNVEVAPKPQVSFTVNPESIEDLIVGHTATIEVEFAENVENVNATFVSADEAIATVDENGVVTGIAPGETQITVTVDEVEQVVAVKVRAPEFAFEVSPEAIAIGTGLNATLEVNITKDEFVEGTEHIFTYSSSDETIAIVDENGVVTGVAKGETVVTVACEGVEVEVPVTVSKVAEGISLTLTDIVTTRGTIHTITATLLGNPEVQEVEFESNDPSVARVAQIDKLSATVSAIDFGDTTVDVRTIDGSMLTVSCRVRVADITTGIDEISIDGETARVYTLSGIEVKGNLNELPAGVYIFKTSKASIKISWKK